LVDPTIFYESAKGCDLDLFTGVPDSLLKDFCLYLSQCAAPNEHVVVANEGAAIALASGHYLSSGGIALVYMQNSGLGNAVNPLLSLTCSNVYQIPLIMLIGWRGETGTNDEPQHLAQGRLTLPLLETLGIPQRLLPRDTAGAVECLEESVSMARSLSAPVAIVVRKDTFVGTSDKAVISNGYEMSREKAISVIVENLEERDALVSTTGKVSRELYECRRLRNGAGSEQDFLVVGSMGHASQIALGVALAQPERRVYCLDGDGALIMHMGSLAIIGSRAPRNFVHVVLNNGCHESVGGQPTAGFDIDVAQIAKACGYRTTILARSLAELRTSLKSVINEEGPCLLEVRVSGESRKELGRPKPTLLENRNRFMKFLQQ
tara:strand:+ start:1215 stop:2345 length:1131 start_codon:yes stop_codon:yes gene_type:complete